MTHDPETTERIARVLQQHLFATVTDWRDEVGSWETLSEDVRNEFRFVARATLDASLHAEHVEALSEALECHCPDGDKCPHWIGWHAKARAALAKARGDQ